jgi:inosine-uridine nucleoside N-ribohydrolase
MLKLARYLKSPHLIFFLEEFMPRNLIIDCDTGLDDAVALLLALRSPEFNVLGITCVNGNVNLNRVVINTLKVVDYSQNIVPVYAGASSCLLPEYSEDASQVHGSDGLGGLPFADSERSADSEHAVEFIVRTIMSAREPIDWVTLGPLTNAALALRREPRIANNVRMLTMMAGGVHSGNTRYMSEYNVFADPEAARIVFDSPMDKTMVPLDPLFNGGHLNKEDISRIREAGKEKPWCDMAAQIFDRTVRVVHELGRKQVIEEGAVSPPDLLAMAIAIDPSFGLCEDYQVFVETRGEYTRGMTVVDRRKYNRVKVHPDRKDVRVVMAADQKKYSNLILKTWLAS